MTGVMACCSPKNIEPSELEVEVGAFGIEFRQDKMLKVKLEGIGDERVPKDGGVELVDYSGTPAYLINNKEMTPIGLLVFKKGDDYLDYIENERLTTAVIKEVRKYQPA